MRRFELFEIHDHRWCPAILRNLFTDALQALFFESVHEPGRVSPLWCGFFMLSANALSWPRVANDRHCTGVVVVIESAVLHGEERPVQENIVARHRDESRRLQDKIKDSRSLAVIIVAKLDLHSQRLPLERAA